MFGSWVLPEFAWSCLTQNNLQHLQSNTKPYILQVAARVVHETHTLDYSSLAVCIPGLFTDSLIKLAIAATATVLLMRVLKDDIITPYIWSSRN